MGTHRFKLIRFGWVILLLCLISPQAIAIRKDTGLIDRHYTVDPTLEAKVNELQQRSDKITRQCEVRQYSWCKDLTTVDISIKTLRGDITDPLVQQRQFSTLEARWDLLDRQVKGLEDRVRYAE